jgi:serine/threonine protein kinase
MAEEVIFTGESGAVWRYWTDQSLGSPGGFGAVYAAEDSNGTPMAVKVIHKQRLAGRVDDRLLRREIEIGRRVSEVGSDMLLPVIDAGDTSEALLLVMARADDVLTAVATQMSETELISVMSDIATGLKQLHSIGIIHRDLKPANVLRHQGRWKLADFGIARDQEIGTQDPTFRGWGSLPYMAPELWEGKSPTVKTDLYALGCLGFELLAGRPPYIGDQAAIREGHLSTVVPDVPCSNVTAKNLITRLIAKDPGDRPQDARAVLDRLHRALLPRSRAQEAIARGLGIHAVEKSHSAAEQAALEAMAKGQRQQLADAQVELRDIISDALEDLHAVEPDASFKIEPPLALSLSELRSYSRFYYLSTADIKLSICIWQPPSAELVPDDTMILAGSAFITNRRCSGGLTSANIVYEKIDDRLGWQIYKFRNGIVPPDEYLYGPYGRTHGLKKEHFLDPQERYFMIHTATHAWSKTVIPLTSDTALELFREAIDLRPSA